jgi:hypothetical protein
MAILFKHVAGVIDGGNVARVHIQTETLPAIVSLCPQATGGVPRGSRSCAPCYFRHSSSTGAPALSVWIVILLRASRARGRLRSLLNARSLARRSARSQQFSSWPRARHAWACHTAVRSRKLATFGHAWNAGSLKRKARQRTKIWAIRLERPSPPHKGGGSSRRQRLAKTSTRQPWNKSGHDEPGPIVIPK